MTQGNRKVKRTIYGPKDWARHARVTQALHSKGCNAKDFCAAIEIEPSYFSALAWGKRHSLTWEKRIATALGYEWSDLFSTPTENNSTGRAA